MGGMGRWILSLWRATLAESPHFESDLGLVIWALFPLALLAIGKSRNGRLPGIAALLFGAAWAAGPQITRFLAAGLPSLALAVAEGWILMAHRTLRRGLSAMLAVLVGANLWITWMALSEINKPFDYFMRRLTWNDYLVLHSPLYRIATWIGDRAPRERVLLVGIEGIHFFRNPVKTSGPFDRKWIVDQAAASSSPRDLADRLLARKITYICIDRNRMGDLDRQFGYMDWPSRKSARVFREMLDAHTRLLLHEGSGELRVLIPKPPPAAESPPIPGPPPSDVNAKKGR